MHANLLPHRITSGLIVNLGKPEGHGKDVGPRDIDGWHIDGDFFVHFLDSPEQALLVVPLWTDIPPSCGGTFICPDAIPLIALHMYDHPEGVNPDLIPKGDQSGAFEDFYDQIAKLVPDDRFFEITGEVGDVYFLHPLMLHSVSNNKLRKLRIITNPNVQLREPFNFARADPSEYSLVELCTKQALIGENLKSWRITGAREEIKVERDSDREGDDRGEQELSVLPSLQRRRSGSSSGSSSSHPSESSDSGSGSDSDHSDDSSHKFYRRETTVEAGKNFLKGVLNPKRFTR